MNNNLARQYEVAIIYLIRIGLGAFLVFNVFIVPGTDRFIIPRKQITQLKSRTILMLISVSSALYVDSLLRNFTNYVLGKPPLDDPWYIHFLGILSLTFLGISLYLYKKSIRAKDTARSLEQLSIIGSASTKIANRLKNEEKVELENLLLKERDITQNSVNRVIKILLFSVLVALIIAIVEELLGRLFWGMVQ